MNTGGLSFSRGQNTVLDLLFCWVTPETPETASKTVACSCLR